MNRAAAFAGLLLPGLLLTGAGGQARAADAPDQESAFWRSAARSGNPAEIQAYLDAYPDGRYRELARVALDMLALRGAPQAPPPVAPPPAAARSPAAQGRIRPSLPVVTLVGGVPLDVEADALHTSSNLRLIVVPAGVPDAIADPQRFVEDSTPITASRLHLTIPAGPPGADEVRLYHIPPFAAAYVLAARAPVTVLPGVAGAVLPLDLAREAARIGPARFEALHRDRPLLVQGAFLGLTPRTDWNLQWFGGQPMGEIPQQSAVIRLGLPNAAPDASGSTGEAVCLLSVADQRLLDRLTTLRGGEPVLVAGIPTTWGAGPADAIVLNRCSFRQ